MTLPISKESADAKLLPCPFCGNAEMYVYTNDEGCTSISCNTEPPTTPTDTERLRFDRQALIDARVFKQTRLIAGNWVPKWYIGDRDSSPEFSSADEALDALWAASRSSGEGNE